MYEIMIIGGGPAGLTAAIYAGKANKRTLLLGKKNPKLEKIHKIENYPGFPEGIKGEELIKRFEKQVKMFGVKIIREEVLSTKRVGEEEKSYFMLETSSGEKYKGKSLIIATGISYKKPRIANVEKFTGRGVSYCVVCDGYFFKDKRVIVVGSKNFAAKEALQLLNYTKEITIYTNGKEPEIGEKFMDLLRKKKIEIKKDRIMKISGERSVNSIILENGQKIKCDGIFVAVGDLGTTDIARQLGIETENNFIKVDKHQKTNVEKVYAAGDCTGGNLQISTAVGEGADAALNLIAAELLCM